MSENLKQFDLFSSENLRDAGIKLAIDHADEVSEKWSEVAYQFLLKFIKSNKEFMTEQIRSASTGIVPEPPTTRAWGGIIVRAKKSGLIKRIDFQNVKNPKAHCTPASVWQVC